MINYRLKDSVVTHFPAIFKGLGSKASVIQMALDVELDGGVPSVSRGVIAAQSHGMAGVG